MKAIVTYHRGQYTARDSVGVIIEHVDIHALVRILRAKGYTKILAQY